MRRNPLILLILLSWMSRTSLFLLMISFLWIFLILLQFLLKKLLNCVLCFLQMLHRFPGVF
ncbi:hypothetical protein I7I53_11657 [Histoplasma capsulatum var. duboisii H88]|uniref:Uncharacterized protein n=1 Tax=Ajellomyces capsulatus (strain H88) TaxID=544711 RepID=A0A8A1LZU9_AJEC8|nr:hypothetical protein I7I53_11657 [Histoplasma capsulatum var. duboisii H88]